MIHLEATLNSFRMLPFGISDITRAEVYKNSLLILDVVLFIHSTLAGATPALTRQVSSMARTKQTARKTLSDRLS